MQKYNEKINFLFCKYILHQNIIPDDITTIKEVYYNNKKPLNRYQRYLIKTKNILMLIKNIEFTYENILLIIKYLTGTKVDYIIKKEELVNIINNYLRLDSEDIFIKIIKDKIFKEEINLIMAKIIFNFISIKKEHIPTIFYYSETNKIIDLINNNKEEVSRIYFKKLYTRTLKYNKKHQILDMNDVIKKLKENEKEIKTKYKIDKIYVFGSYSKEEQTEYSDLDLYIEVEEEIKKNINNKFYIIEYLEKLLNIDIDCIVTDDEFNESCLCMDIIKNLKQIL